MTSDGTGVAVAWANGVSFTAVDPTGEQWFHPLPTAPVAIDMRADGQAAVVALAAGSVDELILEFPDGRMLAATAADGTLTLWPIVL